jgi:ATP-binding cassette subfamily F protein 3
MELIRFQNVKLDYGHREVLTDVSFRINAGEKTGLIGPNGGGKTSIARLLHGDVPISGGAISRAPGLRIGFVRQQVEDDEGATVLDSVLTVQTNALRGLRDAEERLAVAGDEMQAALDAYEAARDAYERTGGDSLRSRATAMLDALGLAGRGEQRVGALSGGEKNVLSLTQALLAEPDLLVLDEPGNHLDFAGIAWLEGFLTRFRGAVLLISHNRYLLDRVVTSILHLDGGRVTSYAGNYSAYRATTLRAKLAQRADYVADQKLLAQLEALVKRFEEIARRTADPAWGKRLRARKSQLNRAKEDAVEKPAAEASRIRMSFAAEASRADIALQVRGYSKAFGERRLFDGAELEISCGERVALLGPNGCGKTTLLREIIAEGAWDHAILRIGPSLRVGYCAQEQEVLDDKRTVLAQMIADGVTSRDRAFNLLRQFLFGREDLDKRVGALSGGERNRLQLARLIAQQPDFLILDEPTNHLDSPACEAIEEALAEFKGTILAVSHDRYFLDKIAGRVVEVRDGRFASHPGNFSEYWAEHHARPPASAGRVATRRSERERPARPQPSRTSAAPSSELQARIEEAERERGALEKRVSEAFTRGDHREGTRAAMLLEQHRARLDELYARWIAEEEESS